jgi:biotin transporter BioY
MELSTPLWVLPYVVVGFLIGLYAKRSSFNNSKKEISIAMLGSELLVFVMNTVSLFLYSKLLYGAFSLPFITGTLLPRFLIALAKGIVYGLITPSVLMKLSVITHNGRR